MKREEIEILERGEWIVTRDGKEGRFQETVPYFKEEGQPYVEVNILCSDGLGRNEYFWPNQIKERR